MTALFEMHVRVGGDPRGYEEFTALGDELAKLGHPACPDVDWGKVEQLCLILLRQNGAELQTVSFYTLASGQRNGLEGMVQGMILLETLSHEWSTLWPPSTSMRLDVLEWLFAQLQSLLRGFSVAAHQQATLLQLDRVLARLHEHLLNQASIPMRSLLVLRQQVSILTQRLQPKPAVYELTARLAEPAFVRPVMLVPPPAVKAIKRPGRLGLCAAALMVALAVGVGWRAWRSPADGPAVPEPVRLDSLSLFDPGSAALNPGATDVLVNALVNIKARPGWLIVIAGHTDATGLDADNLQLSHARASAVRDWMQRMGNIAAGCFAVQGFAASQPIADNDTEAGRMANRRVDIRLVPQQGACEHCESTAC
ncbi:MULTISPECIES: OmpA family protein [Pseudomonas]|uniref:OmpA family protein n=1 Tax=Pseudomonas TaxID=286 RepID=UPI001BE81368|nr:MULTISPECIES: OmpA family protein [Pseudomonas]MBT2339766.1 OmpA family protein [Pseudomonas fluorescens]MCD4528552.1 OmpA family protein [Pseudomonas sp. C3-2018]